MLVLGINPWLGGIFWHVNLYTRVPHYLIRVLIPFDCLGFFPYIYSAFVFSVSSNKIKAPLKLRQSSLENLCPTSFKPSRFLSCGGFGAVWALSHPHNDTRTRQGTLSNNSGLVVKVLYNYYASSVAENGVDSESSTGCDASQWHQLHKQRYREVCLRPPDEHPNIVPILKDLFDRAPPINSNDKEESWENVERFPHGFGGRPRTWYLLMPRFDASLEDHVSGKWGSETNVAICDSAPPPPPPFSQTSGGCLKQPQSNELTIPFIPPYRFHAQETVGLMAQIFEAVAVLEHHHIAHRDIKPSNILVKARQFPAASNVLNIDAVKTANTRLHAALTDFGCAIRTADSDDRYSQDSVSHTGNTVLLAPEVATYFASNNHEQRHLIPDYSRADLWSAASIAYQVFGGENPFLSGQLTSLDYAESDLPLIPVGAPGVIAWVLRSCLRRDPSRRPPACLVADVLHVWCLVNQFRGFLPFYCETLRRINPPKTVFSKLRKKVGESLLNSDEMWAAAESEAMKLSKLCHKFQGSLRRKLYHFLQLTWAADWLLGPANSMGLRSCFYQRITPQRFAYCLVLAQFGDAAKLLDSF
uniref:non-specific serine/threonine protein kinase n=1 Tax=Mesocestoides corti TaxID=53468 RepID=A0A5K3EID0_MESCO